MEMDNYKESAEELFYIADNTFIENLKKYVKGA